VVSEIDPKPLAIGSIKETFEKYPHLESVLPAMGYGEKQISELRQTIAKADCDTIVVAPPIDIMRIMKLDKSAVRVSCEIQERSKPTLEEIVSEKLRRLPS